MATFPTAKCRGHVAPPPLAIIEGCKYDFSVVAAMASMKLAFHVPTYRQQDWFAQYGWFPRRSTVNDLLHYAVETIGPLYRQMWLLLLSQPILLGDDTTLRVLLRDALGEEDLAKLSNRSRFRQATEAKLPTNTGPPGLATSYAWLYTGQDAGRGCSLAVARSRRGASLEPHAALVGQRRRETGIATQRDRRSDRLPAEPVVGAGGVLERRKNSDRQRPIGADHPATRNQSKKLAIHWTSPSSPRPFAVI
jgi:hypothetical protein